MPFTFAHPAIILPLLRFPKSKFSATGLIIGSLSPDFEYFIRIKMYSEYSHTWAGLFYFDLPLGLLVGWIFHQYIRDALILNLPLALKSRFWEFHSRDWNGYVWQHGAVVLGSFLLGAASHIFWDSFTHSDGRFVQMLPALSQPLNVLGGVPVFKILQHASSLLGMSAIAYFVYQLPKNQAITNPLDKKFWAIFALIFGIFMLLAFLNGLNIRLYGQVIVTSISAGFASLLLTALVWKNKK
jgi:Domain of unknown function (DUF4184)